MHMTMKAGYTNCRLTAFTRSVIGKIPFDWESVTRMDQVMGGSMTWTLFSLLAFSGLHAPNSKMDKAVQKADFTLEIRLDRKTYCLREPVIIDWAIRNESDRDFEIRPIHVVGMPAIP